MGALIAVCPTTGRLFDTGIETDAVSLERTPAFRALIDCPHCHERHPFSKDSVLVREFVDGITKYQSAA